LTELAVRSREGFIYDVPADIYFLHESEAQ
jgi:hypothetical protein